MSRQKYARSLSASGASNRWNFDGEFVMYTGSSRSLSTLELVVHRNAVQLAEPYKMMVISVSDEERLVTEVRQTDLPSNWRTVDAYSVLQDIGSEWYRSKRSLLLRVPSAVITREYNYLINVHHRDFNDNVALVRTEDYFWDERLFG